jgi:L,D-transpeptidase ErfK/SrfK
MRLGLPGYLIHGTNRPAGVGMRVTHGCLRMFPEDIEFLFEHVPIDTRVRIVNEPVKIGWEGDELVMEVHPVLATAVVQTSDVPLHDVELSAEEALEAGLVVGSDQPVDVSPPKKNPLTYATEQFIVATAERAGELDWARVEEVIQRADGLPVAVGVGIKNAATSAASE